MEVEKWYNNSYLRLYNDTTPRTIILNWKDLTKEQQKRVTNCREYKYHLATIRIKNWKSCKTIQDCEIEIKNITTITSMTIFKNIIFKLDFTDKDKEIINNLMLLECEILGIKTQID